jgi:hypothetical protein
MFIRRRLVNNDIERFLDAFSSQKLWQFSVEQIKQFDHFCPHLDK